MVWGGPTPEVTAVIVAAISEGMYLEQAALLAGVPGRTFRYWREQGNAGVERYQAFFEALQLAEAKAEQAVIRAVWEGKQGWQSKAWIAERRWPRRWAGRVKAAVTEELDASVEKLTKALDPATMRRVMDALAEDAAPADDGKH